MNEPDSGCEHHILAVNGEDNLRKSRHRLQTRCQAEGTAVTPPWSGQTHKESEDELHD